MGANSIFPDIPPFEVEHWMEDWTVSNATGQYLANKIISDKSE